MPLHVMCVGSGSIASAKQVCFYRFISDFSHGVVSYMINEESDNVLLEYRFTHDVKAGLTLHWAHIGFCYLIDHVDACSILMSRALRKP